MKVTAPPGDGDKKGKGKSKRPKYTKEELKKIRDEIKESMITSAQSCWCWKHLVRLHV